MNLLESTFEAIIIIPIFLAVTVGIWIAMLFGVNFEEHDR
jgi:hypothetical protein